MRYYLVNLESNWDCLYQLRERINNQIRAKEVRVLDGENKNLGILSIRDALEMAQERGLDLIEISPNGNPPVAKLMDYGKYIYSQTKQIQKQKARARDIETKEIRFGLKISEHDLQVKINQAQRFLDSGDKVKITVQLRGREMMFRDQVDPLINRIKNETNANYEKTIERMGNRFFATIARSNK